MEIEELAHFERIILPHRLRKRCDVTDPIAVASVKTLLHSVKQHMLVCGEPDTPQRGQFVRALERAGFKTFRRYPSHPQLVAGIKLNT